MGRETGGREGHTEIRGQIGKIGKSMIANVMNSIYGPVQSRMVGLASPWMDMALTATPLWLKNSQL